MATITPPVENSNDKPERRAEAPARPLWPAPVFVLGVAALVGMATARPFAPDSPAHRIARELKIAREILARPDGDVERAVKLCQNALGEAAEFSEYMGTASFLLGTAHMRLAEKANAANAAESWQRARQYLEQAQSDPTGVPDEDQPLLLYRLGKVSYYTNDDPRRVIERLEEAIPRTDVRSEGYKLLTQAYLRLQPPQLKKALECNLKLRDVPEATEDELSEAKLQGGELLLRLGKPAEARQTLDKIPDKAPPHILVRARLLQARSYQDERQWGNAARLYEKALADQRAPIPEPAQVYYNLGLCYREMDQPQEAKVRWDKCVLLAKGEEGPAAAVVLANLQLLEADPAPALGTLRKAVEKIRTPADWTNKLLDVGKAVSAFEKAAQVFRDKNLHHLALQLLEPYSKLATPFQVVVLRGEVAAEWAARRFEAARGLNPPLEEQRAILDLYVKAGEAFAEAAATAGLAPADQGKYLWLSAGASLSAQDSVKAADQLEKYVKLDVDAAKKGEAYYRLGEVYRNTQDVAGAEKAYKKCMEYETPFAYQARYQLADAALKASRVDDAQAYLVTNLKQLRFEANSEALAQSLFALADILYKHRDYRGVMQYLEYALGKFKDSPEFKDNAEVTQARYQLADSYRQLASMENQHFLLTVPMSSDARDHHQKEHRRYLQMAADEFASLDAFLDTPAGKDHLLKEQRVQVPLITAKCWFNLGQYEKALKVYERAIERCPDQVEGLDALGGAVSCHAALGQINKVRERLLQIKYMLPKMPTETRVPWEKWLELAIKGLGDIEREGDANGAHSTPVVK